MSYKDKMEFSKFYNGLGSAVNKELMSIEDKNKETKAPNSGETVKTVYVVIFVIALCISMYILK